MAKQNKQNAPFDPVKGFFDFLGGLGDNIFGGGKQGASSKKTGADFGASGGLAPGSEVINVPGRVRPTPGRSGPGRPETQPVSPFTTIEGSGEPGEPGVRVQPPGFGGPLIPKGEFKFGEDPRSQPPGPQRPTVVRPPKAASAFTLGERAGQPNPDFSTFAVAQGFLPAPNRGSFKGERGGVPSLDQTKPTTGGAAVRGQGGTINLIPALDDTSIPLDSPKGIALNMVRNMMDANPGFDPFNMSFRQAGEVVTNVTDMFDVDDIDETLQGIVDQAFEESDGDPRLALLRIQAFLDGLLVSSGKAADTEGPGDDLDLGGDGDGALPEDPTDAESVFGLIVDPRNLRQPSTEF